MAKKSISIKLFLSEIIYDVQDAAYLTGRSRQTGANHEEVAHIQAGDDDEERNKLLRSIGNAIGILKSRMSEYLGLNISAFTDALQTGEGVIEIILSMPMNFDDAAISAITGEMHQYIVNTTIAEWLTITDKNDAKEYFDFATLNLANIRDSLHKRTRPVRSSLKQAYRRIVRKARNLFEVEYDSLDYDYAKKLFLLKAPALSGACSILRRGNYIGANYDWLENNDAIFLVRDTNVIGISSTISELTIGKVESQEYTDAYKMVPFYLQRGINRKGLFASINVAPSQGNTRTVPTVKKRDSICSLMLVRYVLDKFETVDEAVEYLQRYVEIYNPTSLAQMGYEPHFLLADESASVVLEFVDNAIVTVESEINTNFHLNGVTLLPDGSVYTNQDVVEGHLPSSLGVEDYGSGLERWNILNAAQVTDRASMRAAMDSVLFSKAYTLLADVWNSEFVGTDITVDTAADDEALLMRIERYREKYNGRSKDNPETWWTAHSCVVDMASKTFYVKVEEENTEYTFTL